MGKVGEDFTASPDKYPQGYFNRKPCKKCSKEFLPLAPSHLYCSDECNQEAATDAYLKRTYGIDYSTYREMLEKQEHKCALCGGEGFLMNKDKHKTKLVVDHCHATGKIRGLLCHNCNRALGLLKDNTEVLRRCIDYLEGATTIPKGSRAKLPEAHSPS